MEFYRNVKKRVFQKLPRYSYFFLHVKIAWHSTKIPNFPINNIDKLHNCFLFSLIFCHSFKCEFHNRLHSNLVFHQLKYLDWVQNVANSSYLAIPIFDLFQRLLRLPSIYQVSNSRLLRRSQKWYEWPLLRKMVQYSEKKRGN